MKHLSNYLIFMLLACLSVSVLASGLKVRVFERGGNAPLSGVAVCLGTSARLDQFGASRTDDSGYAIFNDIPQGPLLVTASRSGFKAVQENIVTSNMDRMLVISLSSGGGGSQCEVGSGIVSQQTGGLDISHFAINNGASQTEERSVTLDNRVDGDPNQFRASERADLRDTQWQDYSGNAPFMLSSEAGRKVVYFQVRRHATINGADLEVLSPVVHDSISLRP